MMSREQNDRISRVGPGDPAGRLLRRYWQPVALLDEFDEARVGPRPVKAVRVLGQDFVLFRDEQGRWGLLDRDCPHRGADLAYGRREDGGLRCPFHGWLFDVEGRCLETPAEPEGSRLCDRVRQRAWPVQVRAGAIWAGVGDGEPAAFPELDCFVAPDTHVFAFKGLWECNWLQSVEVGIDPAHASFLHRFFEDEQPGEQSYGRQFRSASSDSDLPMTKVMREHFRPEIYVEPAPHGLQLTALRRISENATHVRITNQVFPQAFAIPLSDEMIITQFHVPVDDVNNYWYAFFTSFGAPIEIDEGWLLFTHGVGPVRRYSIGAVLLDKADPSLVLARSVRPLVSPESAEREGYVPNVVYTCGAIRVGPRIVLPYAVSDTFIKLATVDIAALLETLSG